jgi:MFS family permease
MSKRSKVDRNTLPAVALLMTLLAGQAMASMDAEILVIAAPSLAADLHASGAQLQLIVAVYTLAFGAVVVTGARLGDVLGHRRVFLLGLTAFTLASLAGGLAPTVSVLTVAVGLQGVGAALMTPQVLSIIQLHVVGEGRARAIGAYSMVLAAGVATGLVVGGLLVSVDLLVAAWRPALLVNAPLGAIVLISARRHLPDTVGRAPVRLDPAGAAALAAALVALIVPLTFGRDAGWPIWVWPFLAASAAALACFIGLERRIAAAGGDPLVDLDVLRLPGVAAGIGAVALVMACYAGLLVSLTLHLQEGLRFSPLEAGLIFGAYASGFATASLTWPRTAATVRDRLPLAAPPAMAGALLAMGLIARGGQWPVALMTPLLAFGGAAHACAFGPLAARLTMTVRPHQASDLSGLVLTASLVGQVLGVAVFVGIYLSAAAEGSARAFTLTTVAVAGALLALLGCTCLARRGLHLAVQRRASADREVSRRAE